VCVCVYLNKSIETRWKHVHVAPILFISQYRSVCVSLSVSVSVSVSVFLLIRVETFIET
jgi:hypothetical protein